MPIAALYGGNAAHYSALHNNFVRLAGEAGLPVGELTQVANTKVPLMVAEVAKEQGRHDKFHRAAFHAYWAQDQNIGEWDVLEPIIENAGIDLPREVMVARFRELAGKVEASLKEGQAMGVTGIPTFFIGAEAVVGAQPYEVLKRVAERNIGRDVPASASGGSESP